MKRLAWGLALGVLLASAARAQEQAEKMQEVTVESLGRAAFTIPEGYGRLADVVVNNEIHYLYFEDSSGAIRVVLIGPRGAAPRSRNPLNLLSPEVYLIKRGQQP